MDAGHFPNRFEELDGRGALSYSSMNFVDAEHFLSSSMNIVDAEHFPIHLIQFFQIPNNFLQHSFAELPGGRILSYLSPLLLFQDVERLPNLRC